MAMLLGGRSAEELVFGEITTGASDDIERCTDIARGMVTQYGMSDILGPQQFGKVKGEVFLGREQGHEADYSAEVAATVDSEVRRLIRSEEHTSELQSLMRISYAVFCLKKKNTTKHKNQKIYVKQI